MKLKEKLSYNLIEKSLPKIYKGQSSMDSVNPKASSITEHYIIKTSYLIQSNVNTETFNNVIYHRKKTHHSYLLYFL